MTKKQHQHTIPRTYLNKFSYKSDSAAHFVDCIDKSSMEIKPELSTSNICVESNFYTIKELPDEEKYKIEDYYSQEIESSYTNVYNLLVDKNVVFISLSQRLDILKALLSLYFRTPKALNEFAEFSSKLLLSAKDNNIKELTFLGETINLENETFKSLKKKIKENNRVDYIETQIALMNQFIAFKRFDGIVVIELTGDKEYITSDNPVTVYNKHANIDLFSLYNSIYVPIDNKHCVFIAPKAHGAIVNRIFRTVDSLYQDVVINDSTFQNAEKWIIGTNTGIPKFKKDLEKFSKPATEDHPIIVTAKKSLEAMEKAAILAENGRFDELKQYVDTIKDEDFFKSNPVFMKMLEDLNS